MRSEPLRDDDVFLQCPRCGSLNCMSVRKYTEEMGAGRFVCGTILMGRQCTTPIAQLKRLGVSLHSLESNVEAFVTPIVARHGSVTTTQVLENVLGKAPHEATRGDQMLMGRILSSLGFERKRVRVGDRREWAYVRGFTPSAAEAPPLESPMAETLADAQRYVDLLEAELAEARVELERLREELDPYRMAEIPAEALSVSLGVAAKCTCCGKTLDTLCPGCRAEEEATRPGRRK